MRDLWRAVRAAAARWSGAEVLLKAVSGAGAYCKAEAQGGHERSGPGGAGRPFPSDAELIEELAERIAREVEAMPRSCRWCCKSLENGHLWCCDVCREDYHRKLMPVLQRGGDLAIAQKIPERRRRIGASS